MKYFFLVIAQLIVASQLQGQVFFEAEGRQIETAEISKTYNFVFDFRDSLLLVLVDSVVQHSNPKENILKTTWYSAFQRESEPLIQIQYLGFNGRDSVSKHFYEGKLSTTYQTNYDSIGRIIYYGMKDFNADSSNRIGFERFYEYQDSLISSGRILIQTIFATDKSGDKTFHSRALTEYDIKDRKVREIRESEPNDPFAYITTYSYNDKDSLISERVDCSEFKSFKDKPIKSKCDIELEYKFISSEYQVVHDLVCEVLLDNKRALTKGRCENFFLSLISVDKQTSLKLIYKADEWCDGKKVWFKATNTL